MIDDRLASTTARLMGVETRSSAHLLIFWNRRGVIGREETLELLDGLIDVGYHLSSKDYVIIKKYMSA